MAGAAAGAGAVLLVTGCGVMPVPSGSLTSGTPSASASAIPGDRLGDVVAFEPTGDDLGAYTHITIARDASAYGAIDPAAVDDSIDGSSWQDEAVLLTGQQFVARFVAEQTLDSIALDTGDDGWQLWLDDVAPQYFGDPAPSSLTDVDPTGDSTFPILQDSEGLSPEFVRDGRARLDDATVRIDALSNDPREGGEYLVVGGTADASYRVSDESAVASLVDAGFGTADEVRAQFPILDDGADGHYLADVTFTYRIERVGDDWQIRDWDVVSDTNFEGVSQA